MQKHLLVSLTKCITYVVLILRPNIHLKKSLPSNYVAVQFMTIPLVWNSIPIPKKTIKPMWQIAAKIIIVGNQPNYHQENEQSSTSQSRTVSLSLVPHLATVQRLDVSFKPIVSTSKSRKYLKEVPIIKLDYSSFYIMFRKWQCATVSLSHKINNKKPKL